MLGNENTVLIGKFDVMFVPVFLHFLNTDKTDIQIKTNEQIYSWSCDPIKKVRKSQICEICSKH
jgi:hypothetical protein